MSNKHCCKNSKANSPDPSTPCYAHEMNDKAHSKSPYGEKEPSTHTTYK